jgi:hypothetical protein
MKFSPDLIARVRISLNRSGYCFFGVDEINRLLGGSVKWRNSKGHEALQKFAEICGAEVETTPHLKSARFTPAQPVRAEVRREENSFSMDDFFSEPIQA